MVDSFDINGQITCLLKKNDFKFKYRGQFSNQEHCLCRKWINHISRSSIISQSSVAAFYINFTSMLYIILYADVK